MPFTINHDLLAHARSILSERDHVYWIIGGAGAGKTTICQALSDKYDIPIYDMDAHIYGDYHSRFTPERHPVNTAWATTENGLAWLLNMSWETFDSFNRAALPEYLDLFVEDLTGTNPDAPLLIDGGVYHAMLLAQVLSPHQIVCLAAPEKSSVEIWEGSEARLAMKDMVYQLVPKPDEAWCTFLEFDAQITRTILKESQACHIAICNRGKFQSIDSLVAQVTNVLGIHE